MSLSKATFVLLSCFVFLAPCVAAAAEIELQSGDHICLIGNELGERMQHHNYWESLLHQRFPKHQLVVRNLCMPGDEPLERLRQLNFGSAHDHLKRSKADVVFFFFGFNESFAGQAGLEKFTAGLNQVIAETKQQDYSGKGSPRMVLVSPIAFEKTDDPNLPDGAAHNERLAMYTGVMAKVAADNAVGFADLFAPTKQLFASRDERLTLNGSHLNDAGYLALAPILDQALFGAGQASQPNKRLKAEIDDKNFHWWHRYRAVNGYSIWGKRGSAGRDGTGTYNNTDVMERERSILDQMCATRDARIWDLAQGKPVAERADDSQTLPFINPVTNVGGENDPNRKRGKLGSLDYLTAEQQQKKFQVAEGYEIELVASEEDFPELANPVALNFDNRGRLWVSVMPSYPHWQPKSKMDDKLLILEDRDGDGRADQCQVFASGLHQPTGFEIGPHGVYVAQQPDILYIQDTDGDDREDARVRLVVGVDSADSHHGPAAFEWGPGGALYFGEGTFKQSQVESPYGVKRLGDAGIWRYDPRTCRTDVHVSLAFANVWGQVFDRWGQNFIADASPGQNFWASPLLGEVHHPDKHPGGSRARHLDFGGSEVMKSYPMFLVKRTRPSSGCEIVSSRHFADKDQGNFLVNNVIGDRCVLNHTVREEASGFTGEEVPPLVSGDDGNFRPVDLQFGPDGALYIVDWHNALIGHLQHNLREPNRDHSHGRIWRIKHKTRPLLKPAKIAGEPIEKLLDLLKVYEDRTRYRVRRELAGRDSDQVITATREWIAKLDSSDAEHAHHLLEALWVHQIHNRVDEALLGRLLESEEPRARAAAVRVLFHWRTQLKDPVRLLKKCLNDPHPRVRLEAVTTCSYLPAEDIQESVLDVLNYDMDVYLEYALDETMRILDSQ